MSFFKKGEINGFQEVPNFILAPDYMLIAEQKDSYTYPVDGWYWFDTVEEAHNFLDAESPEERVQNALNDFAKERDFDSIEDAISFVVSTAPIWKADAQFAIMLRDKVWKTFYETGEVIPMVWPDEI
jgi:prolyl oligopeptidase PreP (S9A serine peptidase family)